MYGQLPVYHLVKRKVLLVSQVGECALHKLDMSSQCKHLLISVSARWPAAAQVLKTSNRTLHLLRLVMHRLS